MMSSPASNDFISNEQLMIGAFHAWQNARYFLEISNTLYSSKKFHAAVPSATIALEECQKSIELINQFKRNNNMTRDEWNKMKNHKHKLTHVTKEAIEILEKMTPKQEQMVRKELQESGTDVSQISIKELIESNKEHANLHSHFQNLRELCLYVDWNEIDSEWVSFSSLSEDRQNALSFFVITEAQHQIEYLEYLLETVVNRLRKNGKLTVAVPYPSYTEHRTPDKFESKIGSTKTMSKADQIRLDQGMRTMQKFITLNSFENVAFGLLRDTMLKYLRVFKNQDDDKWFPHPLVKALMLALEGAREENADGNYMGIGDDSSMTLDGKPFMAIIAIIGKKGDTFTIEKIASVSKENHAFPTDMIERILRTEIILERDAGRDASIPKFVEALSVVGVRAKMIKEEELADAISYVKKLAAQGALSNVPTDTLEEIKNKGREQWDDMKSVTRSLIVNVFGQSKYAGYEAFITPSKGIEKFKARLTIMQAL